MADASSTFLADLGGRRLLLIIGGGIAAYKALELVRLLRKRGTAVRTVMTRAASQFVTPLSLAALTEDKVYQDLFSLTDESEMGHIQLSRQADLLVVAPATANLMAKLTTGLADDLASTVLLATDKPVLMAPAMNVRMWENPATRRNRQTLTDWGVHFVGPGSGPMACGEFGPGRMAEPEEIADAIAALLKGKALDSLAVAGERLVGRRALVTAGPTHEPIDPVRYIANRSSGKQGYAIAAALAREGASVTLVSGPTQLGSPDGVERIVVESAAEMLAACLAARPVDLAVCAAAVADWRVRDAGASKIKKGPDGPPVLELVENPDILATLAAAGPERPHLVVGFAAETGDLARKAREKRERKGCDWIIANDVSPGTGTFGGDRNEVLLIRSSGEERWGDALKDEIAGRLVCSIADHFRPGSGQ